MSRIDFYVLATAGDPSRQNFACRLAEKAYRENHTVHIEVNDFDVARRLDEMLWTFRDGSFVPHDLLETPSTPLTAPVTVGSVRASGRQPDLLINLTDALPEGADAFPRIAEIVTSDEASKSRSRQHFVAYRDAGHALETHKL